MYSHLDFTRCRRPDGSHYGTSGKCRKGSQTGAKEKPFKVGITWGKFNILTPGHARVIKKTSRGISGSSHHYERCEDQRRLAPKEPDVPSSAEAARG
jgi:hypothetical protein